MKYLIVILSLLSSAFAAELKIKVVPENPVYKESFNIEFILKSDSDAEPVINFNPLGIEVLSRSKLGTSTRISYINGESNVEKTTTYSYEMIAPRSGVAFLRDISVEIDDEVVKHATIRIKVLKQEARTKKIFVRAEVDKESAYVGESILIRYYLYSRAEVPLSSTDIKRFPKLDKFLKRFHQERQSPARVQLAGDMYLRRIMYTAQVFAERPGEYKIDPIRMKISYSDRRNVLNNFGFGSAFGRQRSSTVTSPVVKIEVKPLPVQGLEKHFSGLVGKHNITAKINKNKFISNEPIEIELSVNGVGALELFEAPELLTNPNLEAFDQSSDFIVNKDFSASKKISYTYLGRGDVDLESVKIPISYFDPETEKYVTQIIDLGAVRVAYIGEASAVASTEKKIISNEENTLKPVRTIEQDHRMFVPVYKLMNTFLYGALEAFYVFLGIIVCLLIYFVYHFSRVYSPKEKTIFDEIYKGKLTYTLLHKALSMQGQQLSMEETVKLLSLPSDLSEYFFNLIIELNADYDNKEFDKVRTVNIKNFKRLEKAILNYELEHNFNFK